jgi:hypothetical protein
VICSKCREDLPEGRKNRYCTGCARQYKRDRREQYGAKWGRGRGPDHAMMRSYRQRKYGLTPADFEAMLCAQDGVCAICAQPETATRGDQLRSLCVDHNHDTGQIRGLLCSACNTGIGLLGDDVARLEAAASYLRRSQVVAS